MPSSPKRRKGECIAAKKADKALIDEVERAFYLKAAGGLTQKEEKTVTEDDGKGGMKEKREVSVKQLPPDLDAIKAWLAERCPERWKSGGTEDGAGIRVVSNIPRPPGEA